MAERTFSIIKPDALAAGKAGAVLSRLEEAGFRIVALRMRSLSRAEAEGFYHVHRGRPFFASHQSAQPIAIQARNPKHEIRNKFKTRMTQ